MKPPSLLTGLLGTLPVSILVHIGCGTAIFQWFHGQGPGWLAFVALCLMGATRNASQELRRYKKWSAEWQGMDGATATSKPKRKRLPPQVQNALAILSVLIVPFVIGSFTTDPFLHNALEFLWWLSAARLLFVTGIRIRRARFATGEGREKATGSSGLVKWALPRASSSPSREVVTKHLPAYCAVLLRR